MNAAAENYGLDFRHDSYLVQWAIRHAMWTYTRFAKDEDGSPYFVTNGRNYDGEIAESARRFTFTRRRLGELTNSEPGGSGDFGAASPNK